MQQTDRINGAKAATVLDRVKSGVLNALSDHMLVLLGFSPLRVRKGVAGKPWRLSPEARQQARDGEREVRRAVAELEQYSDAALDDLGLSRRDIEHAVRFGRPDEDATVGRVRRTVRAGRDDQSDIPHAA